VNPMPPSNSNQSGLGQYAPPAPPQQFAQPVPWAASGPGNGSSQMRSLFQWQAYVRIRLFDEQVSKMVRRGQIPGAVHTSIGQEAQVVGACMALRLQDKIAGNHRSHGHPIGKGAALGPLMAEIVGKARQVDELAARVANDSRKQAGGITQINSAIGQMDKTTQENAAAAQESAAAAEEMNAQALEMKQSVNLLVELVQSSKALPAKASPAPRRDPPPLTR